MNSNRTNSPLIPELLPVVVDHAALVERYLSDEVFAARVDLVVRTVEATDERDWTSRERANAAHVACVTLTLFGGGTDG